MKSYLLFLACFLLLADASAQQSSKAKSKDRYHEKDQVLPPAEIAVSDAQSFAPLKDVELRLLYMSPQGYMDGRGMSHVFELQEQEKSAKIINYRWSEFGPADAHTDAKGKAQVEFKKGVKQLLLLRLKGYDDAVMVLQNPPLSPYKLTLKRKQPCTVQARGKVFTERYGFGVVGAEVRLVPAAQGEAIKTYTDLDGGFAVCAPQGQYVAWVMCEGFKMAKVQLSVAAEKSDPVDVPLAAAFPDAKRQEIGFISGTPGPEGLLLLDSLAIQPVSTTLSERATALLDEVARLMLRYPQSEVDLVNYTAVRGRADLNQALSDERARNARAYLAQKDIAPHRVRVSGKGGTEPRNHCREGVNCSDGEHERNSRFELRLRREPKD
ncbi:MAG TPA: OmpA family protein [Saprospiraceae bacterium]|nr:OmpA family protein [Saprospiraceae bacterium]HNG89423.1 OmpA family protein [Saprospiraceae bacterium]